MPLSPNCSQSPGRAFATDGAAPRGLSFYCPRHGLSSCSFFEKITLGWPLSILMISDTVRDTGTTSDEPFEVPALSSRSQNAKSHRLRSKRSRRMFMSVSAAPCKTRKICRSGHQRAVEVLLQNGAYWDAQGVRDAAVGVEGLGGGGGVDGWGGGEHGGGDGNGGEGGGGDGGGEGDGEEVDMDTRGVHGDRTPLHLASLAGHTGVVDALLLASADADREDTTGRSALVLATDAGHTAVVLALLRWGVSLHCRGEALHAAAGEGRYNLAGFLLQQGAPVNARCVRVCAYASAMSQGSKAGGTPSFEDRGIPLFER